MTFSKNNNRKTFVLDKISSNYLITSEEDWELIDISNSTYEFLDNNRFVKNIFTVLFNFKVIIFIVSFLFWKILVNYSI